MAGENEVHDLTLPRREAGDVIGRALPPSRQLARVPRTVESALDGGEKLRAAKRLFDEIRGPALMACTAIGTSLLPVIMMAGNA